MDMIIGKNLWLFSGIYIIIISITTAQNYRRLPITARRTLPTVIITKEHLRQRQNLYGIPGDTAAEFVVSAGLDTSKNSAVRIRRIGHRRSNATTGSTRPNMNRHDFVSNNISRSANPHVIRPYPQYRAPSLQNTQDRNGIPELAINRRYHLGEEERNRQVIERRHHLEKGEQHIQSPVGGVYRTPNRNPHVPEHHFFQYRPPIFVPNYQHNRRNDVSASSLGADNTNPKNNIDSDRRRVNLNSNEHAYPIISVKYSTSSVSASISNKQNQVQRTAARPSSGTNISRNPSISSKNNNKYDDRITIRDHNERIHFRSPNNTSNFQKEKQSNPFNKTDGLYISANKLSTFNSKQTGERFDSNTKNINSKSESSIQNTTLIENGEKFDTQNRKENTYNRNKDIQLKEQIANATQDAVSRNPVVESANPDKNLVAETTPLQLNRVKVHEFQTRLIRKPSIILRDQITVNELPRKSDRPRFGPRSLEDRDESTPSHRRRKRQVDFDDHFDSIDFDDERVVTSSINESKKNEHSSHASQRRGKFASRDFDLHKSFEDIAKPVGSRVTNISSLTSVTSQMDEADHRNSRQYPFRGKFSEGINRDAGYSSTDEEVMAFSDFITSPVADRMRLERQNFFKNSNTTNKNSNADNLSTHNANLNSRALTNSSLLYLRNLIASRLLHVLSNFSGNFSKPFKTGRSDFFNSDEQRLIKIMVAPYDHQESGDLRSYAPVVRILKGKFVPFHDIPPEIIPILLETYKPSYTEPDNPKETTYSENQKLTENILDNAIFKLLHSDELLNILPVMHKPRPLAYKVSRKSPSTKYVGSVKSKEPMGRPNYSFSQPEWPLEPRCDRLTEEICLDDSDYPSSAIMSSIYKDKKKFDLMYAEVKVQESQVEGLSRQQEIAYSFEHYYGAYPKANGGNQQTRDYGPQGGFVCPSEVHYARPHRAKNRKGDWKVVVNVGEYTQTLRMEKCLSSGNPCKYVVNHMQSTCSQVFGYHRLLVFSKENGLHIDAFRVPTACTCHLRPGQFSYNPAHAASAPYLMRPNLMDEYGGHVETAPVPQIQAESSSINNEKKKKKSFSNTLWAILGGGQQASALAQQPHFLDEVQKQIMWTQQLKHYPHLMKQISPNQVLKQLLEDDEDDYMSIRRQRIRQKIPMEQLASGGFASHQVPMVVPLPPPPPPPPKGIPRRPVVGVVSMDKSHLFGMPKDGLPKIFGGSSQSEQPNVFSMTKDTKYGNSPFRPIYDGGLQSMPAAGNSPAYSRINTFKVHPGMFPPKSENVQIPESSLLPVAPQFDSQQDSPFKPVMKPMPIPQDSDESEAEDQDLVAAEKSVKEDVKNFTTEIEEVTTVLPTDDDSKINFSYHPILEYLNV